MKKIIYTVMGFFLNVLIDNFIFHLEECICTDLH